MNEGAAVIATSHRSSGSPPYVLNRCEQDATAGHHMSVANRLQTELHECENSAMGQKRTLGRWCLLRFGQFCLDHAPSLFQGFHLSFRRSDDPLRERCQQAGSARPAAAASLICGRVTPLMSTPAST